MERWAGKITSDDQIRREKSQDSGLTLLEAICEQSGWQSDMPYIEAIVVTAWARHHKPPSRRQPTELETVAI